MKEVGDGFGEFAGAGSVGHGESETAREAMAGDAKFLEKLGTAAKGVLGKNGVAEAGFDKTLDGFGIVGFHDNVGSDAKLLEKAINDETDVAAPGIEEEGSFGELGNAHGSDMAGTSAGLSSRGTDDEKLFVEERNEFEVRFGNGKGDKGEIEAAVEEARDHFLGDADGDANVCLGELFAKEAKRAAKLIDERGDAGGEMKRADVLAEVVDESFLDVAHHIDDLAGHFCKASSGGSGNQAFAPADEELGVEFIGQVVKLKTNGAGREVNFFGGAGHARRFHDGEEKLELVDVHERCLPRRAACERQMMQQSFDD